MSEKLFSDRDGAGKTIGRKLEERVNDPENFRTAIIKDGDTETMLRTRGGRPELTVKKPEPKATAITCVKSPLTEIAFKYHVTTAQTGYRRWYGEPDPVAPAAPAAQTYQYSSDGLLCLEARKLQKISFRDANQQKVDFLFAEQPVDPTTPPANLPAVSAAAAASKARFKFTEGKYTEREWYPPERADIGWAFTSPATAVKFFIKRVKSIKFSVTDTLNTALGAILIKWKFAYKDSTPLTGTFPDTACANQNATEVSFPGREFYASTTDGNMEKLTLRVGLEDPFGSKNIRLDFKKPGSFIAAVDPEGATGNTRPADKTKAIDLCEFAAFGNPYHGLMVIPLSTGAPVLYKDITRSSAWGFTPTLPVSHYLNVDVFHGTYFDLRYYNVYGLDPIREENIKRSGHDEDGYFLPDAVMVFGNWAVKDFDYPKWGLLKENEHLYKDPAGNVWIIRVEAIAGAATGYQRYELTLDRRYGVLGTRWSSVTPPITTPNIYRSLGYVDLVGYSTLYYDWFLEIDNSPDSKQLMLKTRFEATDAYFLLEAACVTFSGEGFIPAPDDVDQSTLGDGISISTVKYPGKKTTNIVMPSLISHGWSVTLAEQSNSVTSNATCGLESVPPFTNSLILAPSITMTTTGQDMVYGLVKTVLDYQWMDDGWGVIEFVEYSEKRQSMPYLVSGSNGEVVQSVTDCRLVGDNDWAWNITKSTAALPTAVTSVTTEDNFTYSLLVNGVVVQQERRHTKGTTVNTITWATLTTSGSGSILHLTGSTNTFTPVFSNDTSGSTPGGIAAGVAGWVPVDISNYPRTYAAGYYPLTPRGEHCAFAMRPAATGYGAGLSATMVYRDGRATVSCPDLDPIQGTIGGPFYGETAQIGWAYDFRKKELVVVPKTEFAYFV